MGIIFDMDGVLINSNAAHLASWLEVAKEDGVSFTKETFLSTFGMTSEYIVEHHWKTGLTPEEVADVVERKETVFRESILEHVKPIKGSRDFVRDLADKDVPIAVGSSAPKVNVEYVLDWMKLREFFGDCVVAGNEVKRGKPATDIFLACAQKIGAPPERCVVIEDSRSGVNAGKNAGMTVIGFFSEGHRAEEYENADYVVRSFDELRELLGFDESGALFLKKN
jgi:beta-phosphoglucomutase